MPASTSLDNKLSREMNGQNREKKKREREGTLELTKIDKEQERAQERERERERTLELAKIEKELRERERERTLELTKIESE